MCKFFFTIAFLCVVTLAARAQSTQGQSAQAESAEAQSPTDEVADAVDRFFDGMRAGDSTAVRSVLHPQARLLTTAVRDGKPMLHDASIDKFLEAVGTPHDQVWDERIWDLDIRIDDRLATAWMKYAFYVGDKFSHCGVNAFQFFGDEGGWKIIQITDTRRTEACDLPEDR